MSNAVLTSTPLPGRQESAYGALKFWFGLVQDEKTPGRWIAPSRERACCKFGDFAEWLRRFDLPHIANIGLPPLSDTPAMMESLDDFGHVLVVRYFDNWTRPGFNGWMGVSIFMAPGDDYNKLIRMSGEAWTRYHS